VKRLLFFIFTISAVSCFKDNAYKPAPEPEVIPGTEAVNGTLNYACECLDGSGLTFYTDDDKTLVFTDDSTDSWPAVDSIITRYKDLMGIHSRLTYIDLNKTRCNHGMTIGCSLVPVVKIVKIVKL
jgi:hypothetical protein